GKGTQIVTEPVLGNRPHAAAPPLQSRKIASSGVLQSKIRTQNPREIGTNLPLPATYPLCRIGFGLRFSGSGWGRFSRGFCTADKAEEKKVDLKVYILV